MAENLREEINGSIHTRLASHAEALTLVKTVAILGGAAVAGIAQFVTIGDQPISGWQVAGGISTIFAFLGGLFVVRTDGSAPLELDRARRAIEQAEAAEQQAKENALYYRYQANDYSGFDADARRARELYLAMHAMRGALERLDFSSATADDAIAKALITAANQHLPVALGFEMEHQWTFGIYRAHSAADGTVLKLSAEKRAIPCDPEKARRWPSGIGYVGAAYANRQELIIADTRDVAIKSLLPSGGLSRADDEDRYVSVAAVPILVGSMDSVWGVAIATNNQSEHFKIEEEPGVHAAEAVRALAGMAALGASIVRHKKAGKPIEIRSDGGINAAHVGTPDGEIRVAGSAD